MTTRVDETYLFVVEYFDPMPRLKRQFLLKLFLEGMQIEMVDLKSKKMFLKKSPCPPHVTKEDFFIGGKVLLYARDLEIVDYGDLKTRDKLQHQMQSTVVILPQEMQAIWGEVTDALLVKGNMGIVRLKTVLVPQDVADRVCSVLNLNGRKSQALTAGGSTGSCLVMVVQGEDGLQSATNICSSFGVEFVSKTGLEATDLVECLLGSGRLSSSVTLDNNTCCIVKPHAIKAKLLGTIMRMIVAQGYEISAVASLHFDRTSAEEFLEVYKGVVPEYVDHVNELSGGMSVALEVRAEDAVNTFRQTAGPWDVEMARVLRPDSIRGKYGIDRVRNVIHCTDLAADAVAECEYCFKLLV